MKLGFLEVGVDPDLVQRDHGHQRIARLHALADLYAALGDVAGDRRDDGRAGVVQVGLAQLRGGGLDVRMGGDLGVVDQRAIGVQLLFRAGQRGFRAVQRVAGVGQFLLGNGAVVGEVLAPLVVGLGLGQRDLAGGDLGAIAVDVAEQPAHLAHGVGQVGLGALEGDVGVAGIEPDQFLALAHQVAVVGADADHGADDLRGDLYHVAVDVGVVGVLVPAAVEELPGHAGQGGENDHGEQDQQPALALRVAGGGFAVGGSHGGCLVHSAGAFAVASAAERESGWKPPPRAWTSWTERSICWLSRLASWRSATSSCCCTLRASR